MTVGLAVKLSSVACHVTQAERLPVESLQFLLPKPIRRSFGELHFDASKKVVSYLIVAVRRSYVVEPKNVRPMTQHSAKYSAVALHYVVLVEYVLAFERVRGSAGRYD